MTVQSNCWADEACLDSTGFHPPPANEPLSPQHVTGACLHQVRSPNTSCKPSLRVSSRLYHTCAHPLWGQWRSTTRIGFGSWRLEDQILAVLFALSTVIERTSFQRESGPHGLAPHGGVVLLRAAHLFLMHCFSCPAPHRITAWPRLEGTSGGHRVQHPCRAGSHCIGWHPGGL